MIPARFYLKFKYKYILSFVLAFVFISGFPAASHGSISVETFFQNTDYELNVYRIKGRIPGKTIMIIGGIQGDEPGGFLSADLYADMELSRGNLIVVPRANFYSIILNRRQINEDMNRKFSEPSRKNYEAQVVSILKRLISESDCLLNLHDGSGFYRDTWQNDLKNPRRYGQSIIVDCESYKAPGAEKSIELGIMAKNAVARINSDIKNSAHIFRVNNHRTRDPDSLHPEQKKSATYYALYNCGIPAFGIESSKSLPIKYRIHHHRLAVNAFMEIFDVTPEIPGIGLNKPQMKYAVVKVNRDPPLVVANGEILNIYSGDVIKVVHIEGNYDRGLSVDIEGYGSVNDINKPFAINKPTRIVIKKDHYTCGAFDVKLNRRNSSSSPLSIAARVIYFKIRINGKEGYFPNGSHVDIIKGDLIEMMEVGTNTNSVPGLVCNFKGFVGNSRVNSGEDRGYVINTAKDLWQRYSLYRKGRLYQAIVSDKDDAIIGRLFFDIREPSFEYMVLRLNGTDKKWVSSDDTISLSSTDTFELIDIKSNVGSGKLSAFIEGGGVSVPIRMGKSFSGTNIANSLGESRGKCNIRIKRGDISLASIELDITDKKLALGSRKRNIN